VIIEENVFFKSDDLLLQGALAYADDMCRGPGVVLCAPHPQLGGDMENNIITAIHNRAAAEKIISLRFNYRGVGQSQGLEDKQAQKENLKAFWDDSWSPVDARRHADALSAISFLKGLPGLELDMLFVVGYSFGAYVAQHAAIAHPDLAALILISPTFHFHDFTSLHRITVPKLIISSDNDFSCTREEFAKSYKKISEPKSLKLFSGAEHFFIGHEDAVSDFVIDFMLRHWAGMEVHG
jgi:alpha/beta superfamily hydrolase